MMGMLQAVLGFKCSGTVDTVLDQLSSFDVLVQKFEAVSSHPLAEEVKMAILAKSVPEPLRSHLMVQASQYKTTQQLRSAIREYCLVRTHWKMQQLIPDGSGGQATPMEIDSLQTQRPPRVGKAKGKGKGKRQDI